MTLLDQWIASDVATYFGTLNKTVTFRHASKTGGANPTITYTDYTVRAVVDTYPEKLVDGTVIKIGDLQVILQPVTTAGAAIPAPTTADDRIVIDGKSRTVGVVTPLYAGSAISAYEVQAKG